MMHFYPRNPYRYARAGHIPPKQHDGFTRTQKMVMITCWAICLIIIGIKAYQYYFPFGL